ncbi:MAG: UDP-N-acetylmuramoyl-L-alanine--D-glutamate ligase [Gemmatimonadaceae bacterium]|nr:UDP-N-acetylmuramoyl-L-alanine--D-glutamate ligase [Gemmatimonadaceae bacterium]
MIFDPPLPRGGEIAIVGLGRSGLAATELLRTSGASVYVSDASDSPTVREAAERAVQMGATADTGKHDLQRIARATILVASPGIGPAAPPLKAAAGKGVPIVSEVEIGLRALRKVKYIAVTGTNGKSTTTALIAHLLRGLGANAVEAGNIGTPLCSYALSKSPPEWISLEMSSFQLHDTPSINPEVGVLTNLSADHLDRYDSVRQYYADKALLFRNASDRSNWVINADDSQVEKMVQGIRGRTYRFSVTKPADAFLRRTEASQGAELVLKGLNVLKSSELPVLGQHNVANVLSALLAVSIAHPKFQKADALAMLADAVRSFKGLPHRLEIVSEKNCVLWINDSKATNVSSTLVAVQSMTRPFVLLLGGKHKGESYSSLAGPMKRLVRKVIAYGESADLIEKDLKSAVDVEKAGNDFESVLEIARKNAKSGDAVLLSPACSSYDMFLNFEERGDRFREIVGTMK